MEVDEMKWKRWVCWKIFCKLGCEELNGRVMVETRTFLWCYAIRERERHKLDFMEMKCSRNMCGVNRRGGVGNDEVRRTVGVQNNESGFNIWGVWVRSRRLCKSGMWRSPKGVQLEAGEMTKWSAWIENSDRIFVNVREVICLCKVNWANFWCKTMKG